MSESLNKFLSTEFRSLNNTVLWYHIIVMMTVQKEVWCWLKFQTAQWCSGYHYWLTSFNKAWAQVLRRFKSWQWWRSLTMASAGNRTKGFSSVNHTTKTIYHHHHHHHRHQKGLTQSSKLWLNLCSFKWLSPNLNLVSNLIPDGL